MAKVLGRVSGAVLDVEERSGTSKAGNPYRMRTASVIVTGKAIIAVTLTDDAAAPGEGELVDWLVELTAFRDEVQGRYVSDFPSATKSGLRSTSQAS